MYNPINIHDILEDLNYIPEVSGDLLEANTDHAEASDDHCEA